MIQCWLGWLALWRDGWNEKEWTLAGKDASECTTPISGFVYFIFDSALKTFPRHTDHFPFCSPSCWPRRLLLPTKPPTKSYNQNTDTAKDSFVSEGRKVFSDLPSLLVIFLQSAIEIVIGSGIFLCSVSAFQYSISSRSINLSIPKKVFS